MQSERVWALDNHLWRACEGSGELWEAAKRPGGGGNRFSHWGSRTAGRSGSRSYSTVHAFSHWQMGSRRIIPAVGS